MVITGLSFFLKELQLALQLSVHPLVVSVEILNVQSFPSLPHLGVIGMDFFYNCNLHISHAVSRQIKMSSSELIQFAVP